MGKKRLTKISLLLIAVAGILDTIIIRSRSGGMDFGIMLPGLGGLALISALIFTNSKLYKKREKLYNRIGKFILGYLLFGLFLS